jgi:hypothetical protein
VLKLFLGFLALTILVTLFWASDRITMQGERTIYTVRCERGAWEGVRCTGMLVPSERHAFRASKSRHEVIYWIRESDAPSGKYTDCSVTDRDTWTCNVRAGQKPTIAYEMVRGKPTRTGASSLLPFHAVPKWKWWLMDVGVSVFSEAEN